MKNSIFVTYIKAAKPLYCPEKGSSERCVNVLGIQFIELGHFEGFIKMFDTFPDLLYEVIWKVSSADGVKFMCYCLDLMLIKRPQLLPVVYLNTESLDFFLAFIS